MTGGSGRSHDHPEPADVTHDKASRANLSLSFAQQVARCGRGRRDRDRDHDIPENHAVEKDAKLRSYMANERDSELRGYESGRDRQRDERHGAWRGDMSPLYASPPRTPVSDICSPTQPPTGSQPASLSSVQPAATDTHFNRDTHMRIILGRDTKPTHDRHDSKGKRNGIVTNPAMRLVANVRNGLDSAAANIRRTGVALAASASSNNPAVKTNAFQWRKETPL